MRMFKNFTIYPIWVWGIGGIKKQEITSSSLINIGNSIRDWLCQLSHVYMYPSTASFLV